MTLSVLALAACSNAGAGGDPTSAAGPNDDGFAWAKAIVDEHSQRPTSIPKGGDPIKGKVPSDKTIAYISCATASCTGYIPVMKAAGDALGWKLTTFPSDSTPPGIKAAWASALATEPDGIIYSSTDRSIIDAELKQAEKLGILVAGVNVDYPLGNGLTFVAGNDAASTVYAETAAAEIIVKSGGKANVAVVSVPSIPIVKTISDRLVAALKEHCSDCTAEIVDIPVASLGKDAPQQITAYLTSHPKVDYITVGAGPLMLGLPAAIAAVGIESPTIVAAGSADPEVMAYINDGVMYATAAFDTFGYYWACYDAFVRAFTQTPQIPNISIPVWLIHKNAVVSTTQRFPFVEDMEKQYKEAWGIS